MVPKPGAGAVLVLVWCTMGELTALTRDNGEEDVGAGNGAPTMTTPLLSLFAIIRLVYLLLKRKYIYQNIDFPFSWAEYQIFWFMASACRQLGPDFYVVEYLMDFD